MMKKIFSFALSLALLFCFTAIFQTDVSAKTTASAFERDAVVFTVSQTANKVAATQAECAFANYTVLTSTADKSPGIERIAANYERKRKFAFNDYPLLN